MAAVWSVAMCVIAPAHKWWLTENWSTMGGEVDWLFNMILAITGVTFVLVNIVLLSALWKFGSDGTPRKAQFFHGNHKLEVIWTAVPAMILVFIAIVQWGTWLKIKRPADFPEEVKKAYDEKRPFAEILAGQFEWRITYPEKPGDAGPAGKLGGRADVHVLNNLHVVRHRPILLHLRSRDVLHSFYLPNFRIKQDAVPGMTIPVWFEAMVETPMEPGKDYKVFDLMCAELCGWGHYKMKGALVVHETQESFDAWLSAAKKAEEATQ
jgi:cytochrome c oxidase subunit 2